MYKHATKVFISYESRVILINCWQVTCNYNNFMFNNINKLYHIKENYK